MIELKQQVFAHHKKSHKKLHSVRLSSKVGKIAAYVGVFAVVISLVSVGYRKPNNSDSVANAGSSATLVNTSDTPSVDEQLATSIAADVAEVANLPVAKNVASLSISLAAKSDFAQVDETALSKPQIIQPTAGSRDLVSYTTKTGDTVDSIATAYGVTKETIKWANNLTSDALEAGRNLVILPINGVKYTAKSGDTVDSIAQKYKANKDRIVSYNDLELAGMVAGQTLIIPDGVLPDTERPGYVAPVVTYSNTFSYAGAGTGFGGRTWRIGVGTADGPYAHGNCTLYAYNRRIQLGLPVGGNWGNAVSWAYNAAASGLIVNRTPSAGAVMQNGGGYGHVAIVEEILENGDLSISEMNASVSGGGYNIISGRIVPAGNVGQYLYIH